MPTSGAVLAEQQGNPAFPQRRIGGATIAGLTVAALITLFIAGWAGWGLHAAAHPAKKVRVDRAFTGTVSWVGNNGAAGCVTPDSGGRRLCSGLFIEPGHPVRQGDKVRAAYEHVDLGWSGYWLLLIYPQDPDK